MILTEKHIIKKSHKYYRECDELCYKAKNIYNAALYSTRQHYFKTNKHLTAYSNFHIIKTQECYNQLNKKVGGQILQMVGKEYKSFFALLKLKRNNGYDKPVKIPSYKHKTKGRYVVPFEKQAIGLGSYQRNKGLKLGGTNIIVKTQLPKENIRCVKIIPRLGHFVISVSYYKPFYDYTPKKGKVAAIDLGMNNLMTTVYNTGEQPVIINGKPLKSINQFYNKKLASLKTELSKDKKNKCIFRAIRELHLKRNNKVNDYLHKSSRLLVNQLVSSGIETLIIGKNPNMKQDINIGKVNNQNFVQIPVMRLAEMMEYKLELFGIKVLYQEESYTSKCKALLNFV